MTAGRLSLVVHGAGRMGRQVAEQAAEQGFDVLALVARHHPGELGAFNWRPGLDALEREPDLLIDFSLPAGCVAAARWCSGVGVPLLSGTTGLDATQDAVLDQAADHVPLLHAANFSPGLNAMLGALAHLGSWLPEIEAAEITDVHHVHKRDTPSGTALALARSLLPLDAEVSSRREGEVIGQHEVTLRLPGETLTLSHAAEDRGIFARGALQAGRWLMAQPPGRYQALDWLMGQRG